MSNEQVEQSSDGTQLEVGTQETNSITFPTKADEDPQVAAERTAFKTYVESSGQATPENFNDTDAWFNSLKEAQSNYTRGQQEIASLKQQYAEQGGVSETDPAEVSDSLPSEVEITPDTPELRIPDNITKDPEPATEDTGINPQSYEAWGIEMAQTGTLSELTRADIKQKTGFTEGMIDDYVSGQKARLKESFAKASSVVGGREKLQQIFDWAGTSLSPDQQKQINVGLASPSYEVTLRGLSSMYEDSVTQAKAAEPSQNRNLTSMSASETGIRGYSTKREFTQERNSPKFNVEPRYRQMVEARMSKTDWNTLPK